MSPVAANPPAPTAITDGGTSLPPNLAGGSQPTNRLPDAKLALTLIKRRTETLETKWAVWEEVRKKYDCEPPDDPGYLKSNGLGHSTNVCWGTMESRVDEIVETYYNLANGGKTFLRFHSRAQGPQATKSLALLAEEHKILWDGWNGRQEMMETLVFHRSIYPFSAVYYDQPTGWHAKALHPRNLVYPDGAGTDVDTWFWCAVRTSFEAWQLLEKLADQQKARDVGWKPEAIRKACEMFCKEGAAVLAAQGAGATWANVTWDRLKPHDLAFNDRIPAFVVYVKEWDGKVTEHILVDHAEVGYIYSKIGKHAKLSDALRVLPHGLGAGTLDSVRSYGVKTLHYHDALDRLTNSEYDTALITSSLILQADGGTGLDKMADLVLNMGGISAIPSGFTPAQVSFRDSAAGLRLLNARLTSQLARNTPSLAGDVDIGDYEKSQKEAAMVYQTTLQLGLFKVDRFRTQMDGFCETHWKRLLGCLDNEDGGNGAKEAVAFFKLVASLGVDPALLPSIYRVSHRTGGARGNRVNAQLGMDRSRQYFGMFSEQGKREFARKDIALALDDEDEAEVWLNTGAPPDADTEQARLAQLENASMASGQPVQTAGTDIDGIHMREHTFFVAAEIDACKQGQRDPAGCLRTITLSIQHAQGHFQRLAQDRFFADQIKPLAEQWSQFENFRRQLAQQLAQQQQTQQERQIEAMQTPRIDPKEAQKLTGGALEIQQNAQKHEQELRQQRDRHEQEMRNAEEEHALKMREGAAVRAEA